jgi:hypothetical protein
MQPPGFHREMMMPHEGMMGPPFDMGKVHFCVLIHLRDRILPVDKAQFLTSCATPQLEINACMYCNPSPFYN